MAKYYILLEHLLYITWAFIIYYLGKYYYWGGLEVNTREFSSHAIRHWGGLEAIIGVYITLSAPVVLLNIYEMCRGAGVADKRKKSAAPFVELRL